MGTSRGCIVFYATSQTSNRVPYFESNLKENKYPLKVIGVYDEEFD